MKLTRTEMDNEIKKKMTLNEHDKLWLTKKILDGSVLVLYSVLASLLAIILDFEIILNSRISFCITVFFLLLFIFCGYEYMNNLVSKRYYLEFEKIKYGRK